MENYLRINPKKIYCTEGEGKNSYNHRVSHFKPPSKNSIWRGIKGYFWWFLIIDLSLSRVALAHSNGCYSDKEKKKNLNPQITAIIPLGTDQGLLFIQPLFISTDLKPDTMFLLALQVKTDNLWEFMAHQHLLFASQAQNNLLYREKSKFPGCQCSEFTAAFAKYWTSHLKHLNNINKLTLSWNSNL